MSTEVPQLLTVGVIADKLGVRLHTIEYLLRNEDIRPVARAGQSYVYGEDVVQKLAAIIARRRAVAEAATAVEEQVA